MFSCTCIRIQGERTKCINVTLTITVIELNVEMNRAISIELLIISRKRGFSGPAGIRTPGLRLRRPAPYPG